MQVNIIIIFFFFNDTATTEIYTLSLHDALPIFLNMDSRAPTPAELERMKAIMETAMKAGAIGMTTALIYPDRKSTRLNSSHSQISYAVFCLKKKKKKKK